MRLGHDVWWWFRASGATAGAAVTAAGVLACLGLRSPLDVPGLAGGSSGLAPAAALALAFGGLALLLLLPLHSGALRRRSGHLLGAAAAAVAAAALVATAGTGLVDSLLVAEGGPTPVALPPAGAVALLLTGLGLALLDVAGGPGRRPPVRPADPLLACSVVIALVALVTGSFGVADTTRAGPDAAMSPHLAALVLLLAAGGLLIRPEQGLLGTAIGTGPGATVARRLGPVLLLGPFVAVLASGLAAHSGVIRRPATAVTIGAVAALLVVLLVVADLIRRLDRADREQRRMLAALQERQEFTDTMLQSINEGVVVLDTDYRVLNVNSRWQELTGRRAEDALGRRPPYPWQPATAGGDQLLHRPDGSAVPVLTTTATIPDRDGRPLAYVETYVDITERKRDEDALAARAAQVQQANDQLREANRKLEEALTFKSDLMSMLSHEVSQPISSIASLAELLTADWEDLPEEVRIELAAKIDKNTRRLIGMMNDLTLLFRLDAGKVTARRTPVPVREVVETVVSSLPPDAGVEVSVDGELSALADRGHLWHVVQNLLSNALKYGSAPVQVHAWQDADQLVVCVRDHGKGIPPELLPDLFDRFTRGTGLGLFIVRQLVEANGGTVRYEPGVPQGALLVVTLEAANVMVPGT